MRRGLRPAEGAVARCGRSPLPLPRPRWVRRLLRALDFLSAREHGGGRWQGAAAAPGYRCRLDAGGAAGSRCPCLPALCRPVLWTPPPAHPPTRPAGCGHRGFAACLPLLQAIRADVSRRLIFLYCYYYFFGCPYLTICPAARGGMSPDVKVSGAGHLIGGVFPRLLKIMSPEKADGENLLVFPFSLTAYFPPSRRKCLNAICFCIQTYSPEGAISPFLRGPHEIPLFVPGGEKRCRAHFCLCGAGTNGLPS